MQTTIALNAATLRAATTGAPALRRPAPRRNHSVRRNTWADGAGEGRVSTIATALVMLCLAPVIAATFAQVFVA